jgi:signal peptidase I
LIESTQEPDGGVARVTPSTALVSDQAVRRVSPVKLVMRNFFAEWAFTVLVMLFASTSLGWSYVIPTGSMEDTLLVGDHIFVDKLSYAPASRLAHILLPYQNPRDGDVIAFHYPVDPAQMFVKRVIGQPGDRIRIVNQQLFRNGVAVHEPYVRHKAGFFSAYRDNFPMDINWLDVAPDTRRNLRLQSMLLMNVKDGELVVPPDKYFALGDNRDNSLDSRYWGLVPRDNIVGKPVLVFWSYNATTDELMPGSGPDMLRHMISVGEHFFTRTRWDRTFHLVRSYEQPGQ